ETYLALTDAIHPETLSQHVGALRRRGQEAYPIYIPAYHFRVETGETPLTGVREVSTVLENDDGTYTTYDSDELRFRNPAGSWRPGAQVALLGGSFVHGIGARNGHDLASLLRPTYPHTLNVGVSGVGQLVELALLREYVARVRPREVVVVYFEGNDLVDT